MLGWWVLYCAVKSQPPTPKIHTYCTFFPVLGLPCPPLPSLRFCQWCLLSAPSPNPCFMFLLPKSNHNINVHYQLQNCNVSLRLSQMGLRCKQGSLSISWPSTLTEIAPQSPPVKPLELNVCLYIHQTDTAYCLISIVLWHSIVCSFIYVFLSAREIYIWFDWFNFDLTCICDMVGWLAIFDD